MSIKNSVSAFAIHRALAYLEKDPETNLPKLMAMIDKFAGDDPNSFPKQREVIRKVINDPTDNWYKYIMNVVKNVDNDVLKTVFTNFIVNGNLIGWKRQEEIRQKYNCNVPWAILLDPTSACNLHCTGCWAAEYGNKLNLTFDEIDNIIEPGQGTGRLYVYLHRRRAPGAQEGPDPPCARSTTTAVFLCLHQRHPDRRGVCRRDAPGEELCPRHQRWRALRRPPMAAAASGVYEKVHARHGPAEGAPAALRHLRLLHQRQLWTPSPAKHFIDKLIDWGAYFIWYFHYMPVGNDASPELLPTPEQRTVYLSHASGTITVTDKPLFTMDFQNDGEYVGGCIAGGRRYLHINANGDVRPLRVHPLFRLQYPGEDACWRRCSLSVVHGLSRWPALQ